MWVMLSSRVMWGAWDPGKGLKSQSEQREDQDSRTGLSQDPTVPLVMTSNPSYFLQPICSLLTVSQSLYKWPGCTEPRSDTVTCGPTGRRVWRTEHSGLRHSGAFVLTSPFQHGWEKVVESVEGWPTSVWTEPSICRAWSLFSVSRPALAESASGIYQGPWSRTENKKVLGVWPCHLGQRLCCLLLSLRNRVEGSLPVADMHSRGLTGLREGLLAKPRAFREEGVPLPLLRMLD